MPISRSRAFTLIELLVVIAIIAILAAILFPVFAQAKNAAKKTADLSNMKQIALGLQMYGGDYDDTMPLGDYLINPPPSGKPYWVVTWRLLTQPYIKSLDLFESKSFKTREAAANVYFDYTNVYEDAAKKVPLGFAGMAVWALSAPDWEPNGLGFTTVPRPANYIMVSTSRFQFGNVGPWTGTKDWHAARDEYPGRGTFIAYSGKANYAYYDGHVNSMNPCATYGNVNWESPSTPAEDYLWSWKPRDWPGQNDVRFYKHGNTPGSQANDVGCMDIQDYR